MKERLSHIDGLRGIAVFSVVLFHAGVHNSALRGAGQTPLAFILRQGCHGVDLFFILSGFCLAYPALARVRTKGAAAFNVSGFAARRIVRIVPPYYAAIAAFAILGGALLLSHVPLPEPMAREALSPGGIVKQALFLDGDRKFLDASFWTLAIEFRWYFMFPVLLWIWVHFPKAFGAIAVAAMVAGATRIQNVDLFFLPFFMLGVVAAELHARGLALPALAIPAAILSTIVAGASTAGNGWYFIENGPFWGVAMFCLVVAAGSTPLFRRLLSSRLLVFLGTVSYGVYLVHEPVVALIERAASSHMGGALSYGAAVAGALAVGTMFSIVAERPFVSSALRDRIVAHLEPAVRLVFARLGTRDAMELRRPQTREAIAA